VIANEDFQTLSLSGRLWLVGEESLLPDKQHETNRQLLHNSARNATSHKHHKMHATQPKSTGRGRGNVEIDHRIPIR
jgi:hypothetical protein